ncbi:unnamed protein product [Toxocara canis]|uniref:Uncharacterized protein n=1 Tax=Toxocara canis TaxID=6265 RepID=A0A183UZ87_TOXCA|nr:unnamed protein product [Toxocara canis]
MRMPRDSFPQAMTLFPTDMFPRLTSSQLLLALASTESFTDLSTHEMTSAPERRHCSVIVAEPSSRVAA